MRQRTMILDAIWVHFAEFGIIAVQGRRKGAELVRRLGGPDEFGLPAIARTALYTQAFNSRTWPKRSARSHDNCWHGMGRAQRANASRRSRAWASSLPLPPDSRSERLQVRPAVRGL